MKHWMLTGSLVMAAAIDGGDGLYWVVGNRATQRCDIVTSNPVIFGDPAYDTSGPYTYWFGDGPYKSRDDARLARMTTRVCPPEPEEPAGK